MKHIQIKLIVVLLLISQISWSQLENANWYFSDHAGLNFEGSQVNILNDGQIPHNGKNPAVISDNDGNLLFYTNGEIIWNQNHEIMENGINNLSGGFSDVIIVPFPNNSQKYYIFYTRGYYENGNKTEYLYSIINIDVNGGLGIVELQNQNLLSFNYSTRGNNISSTFHSDGNSYWLMINTGEDFYSFKISDLGIESAIISSLHPFDTGRHNTSGMAISQDGTKIAYLLQHFNFNFTELIIYNFDKSNGTITFYYGITTHWDGISFEGGGFASFSPDGNFLYIAGGATNNILQLDMNNLSETAIPEVIFDGYDSINDTYYYFHDGGAGVNMQIAQNGKIYICGLKSNGGNQPIFLSVINNPNNQGANCNFALNGVEIISNSVAIRVPQLIPIILVCQSDLNITQNVNSSQIDIQESSNTITATNIIFPGATAEYDAGQIVFLKPGFNAKQGSNFRAYIEGCNIDTKPQKGDKKHLVNNNELKTNSVLKVYPNPTTNKINIESLSNFKHWKLTNSFGNIKRRSSLSNVKEDVINLDELPNGLYYLNVIYKNGKTITKTIVKK